MNRARLPSIHSLRAESQFLVSALLAPAGLVPGGVVAILWFIVFWRARASFAGLFQARTAY